MQDKSCLSRAACLVHPCNSTVRLNNQAHGAGDINVPGSSVTTQQLSISQAGAAQDGSQDVTLGSLSASAASGSPTTVTLAAADGTAGTTGGTLSASSNNDNTYNVYLASRHQTRATQVSPSRRAYLEHHRCSGLTCDCQTKLSASSQHSQVTL